VSQSLKVARAKTEQMELTKQNRFFYFFYFYICSLGCRRNKKK